MSALHAIALVDHEGRVQCLEIPTLPEQYTERILTDGPTGSVAGNWIPGRTFHRAYVYDEALGAHRYHLPA